MSVASSVIEFNVLQEGDIQQLFIWSQQEHVAAWWHDSRNWNVFYKKYYERLTSDIVRGFIIVIEQIPVGYIQYYRANTSEQYWCESEPDTTVGIDLYIGEPEYVGRGFGTKVVRAFCQKLFDEYDVKKIVVDPDERNERSIRLFERVGFVPVMTIYTAYGQGVMMKLEKQ
jgi:RimJ/RimL family protein N-acetyltransferase